MQQSIPLAHAAFPAILGAMLAVFTVFAGVAGIASSACCKIRIG